jgi:site-specific recombinase XerD
MLEQFFEASDALDRLRASRAGRHVDGFAAWLAAAGYAGLTGRRYLRAAAHLVGWHQGREDVAGWLDDEVVRRFAKHLPTCRCRPRFQVPHGDAIAGARRLREYLSGVASAAPMPCRPTLPLPPLVEQFRTWMLAHRGVRHSTLAGYLPLVVEFVATAGADPARYDAAAVRGFIVEAVRRHGGRRGQTVGTALRMFLRCLAVHGQVTGDLVAAVPAVACWRLAPLPGYLPQDAVERVIAACDHGSRAGLRDRAIILLLARLGLRAGDVADLRVADVDWAGGRLRVIGKNRREAWLPLPQEVGDAILAYLQDGRPAAEDDHLFLRAHAPRRALRSGSSVSYLVGRVIRRAGIQAPSHGAHLLRHSLASQMLRDGASLDAIALLLRHRALETTELYAKVDVDLLRSVAQPWPAREVPPC